MVCGCVTKKKASASIEARTHFNAENAAPIDHKEVVLQGNHVEKLSDEQIAQLFPDLRGIAKKHHERLKEKRRIENFETERRLKP